MTIPPHQIEERLSHPLRTMRTMPRPKWTRAELVGHGQYNTFIWPETAVARDTRLDWPLPATLAQRHLTLDAYKAMYEAQNGSCAICKTPREPTGLVIDHNHKTHKVRGLLCTPCNTGLGFFKDSPDLISNALTYLDRQGCYGANTYMENLA